MGMAFEGLAMTPELGGSEQTKEPGVSANANLAH
jgi:hypothetical protein